MISTMLFNDDGTKHACGKKEKNFFYSSPNAKNITVVQRSLFLFFLFSFFWKTPPLLSPSASFLQLIAGIKRRVRIMPLVVLPV